MGRISDLVQQALATGYLSLAAEEQLRSLLRAKNEPEELMAFWQLQQAAMAGNVRQESRDQMSYSVQTVSRREQGVA